MLWWQSWQLYVKGQSVPHEKRVSTDKRRNDAGELLHKLMTKPASSCRSVRNLLSVWLGGRVVRGAGLAGCGFKSRLPCCQVQVCESCSHIHASVNKQYNWMAPWKNWISSTSTKLRKSLVKPVTRQNISSCSVLSPEIVIYDAFNVILWMSADICVVVHDDLGWKNRTTRYILPHHWLYEWFLSATNVRRYMRRAWPSRCNRFWRAGCSRLEYVNIV